MCRCILLTVPIAFNVILSIAACSVTFRTLIFRSNIFILTATCLIFGPPAFKIILISVRCCFGQWKKCMNCYYICTSVACAVLMLVSGVLFIVAATGVRADGDSKTYGATMGCFCLLNSLLFAIVGIFTAGSWLHSGCGGSSSEEEPRIKRRSEYVTLHTEHIT